jgi:integral membrane protein (TIGR00529 family)
VYPAIIIISVVLVVPLSTVVIALLPLTALSISYGAITSSRILKNVRAVTKESKSNITRSFFRGAWPILFLITSVISGLEAMIAFPLTLALLSIQQRVNWGEIKPALKYGLDPKILLLLYSVMLFKAAIENSGAAQAVLIDMQVAGLPSMIILVVLPFIMGFATGYGPAYAGVAFPLLVPYIVLDSSINNSALLLAYASGLIGLLISPVHLCLLLSAQYFKANFSTVYKYILPPVLAIEISVIIIYLLVN